MTPRRGNGVVPVATYPRMSVQRRIPAGARRKSTRDHCLACLPIPVARPAPGLARDVRIPATGPVMRGPVHPAQPWVLLRIASAGRIRRQNAASRQTTRMDGAVGRSVATCFPVVSTHVRGRAMKDSAALARRRSRRNATVGEWRPRSCAARRRRKLSASGCLPIHPRDQKRGSVRSVAERFATVRSTAASTSARRAAIRRTPILRTALDRRTWCSVVHAERPHCRRSRASPREPLAKIPFQTVRSHVARYCRAGIHAPWSATRASAGHACGRFQSSAAVVAARSIRSAIKERKSRLNASAFAKPR